MKKSFSIPIWIPWVTEDWVDKKACVKVKAQEQSHEKTALIIEVQKTFLPPQLSTEFPFTLITGVATERISSTRT